jgi:hypothetical protein
MVQKFNVRDYIEKVWCPDESRFMRMDVQQIYRHVFQYLAKREKAITGKEAAEAFKPALIRFLDIFKTKIETHVTDEDVEKLFSAPIKKLFAKTGECENDKYELPLVRKLVEFVVSHQGYLTKKDLQAFKAALEAFLKATYAQAKALYQR